MKKLIAVLSAGLLALGLAACSSKSEAPPVPSQASVSSSSAPASSAPVSSSASSSKGVPADAGKAPADATIAGEWTVYSANIEGMEVTVDEMESLLSTLGDQSGISADLSALQASIDMIKSIHMTVNDDGTGTMSFSMDSKNQDYPFTWKGADGEYTIESKDQTTTTVTHNADDSITLAVQGNEVNMARA